MVERTTLWYALLTCISVFGVATWWLHNFSDKDNLKRISAFSGVISMLAFLMLNWGE